MGVPLPAPTENQAYWDVSAIEAGVLKLPLRMFLEDHKDKLDIIAVPSLAFVLRPRDSTIHGADVTLLFDLGIRKDFENYPPANKGLANPEVTTVMKGVHESLKDGGLDPKDVNFVVISHAHWDHVGDPTKIPNAQIFVGAESRQLLQPGYPEDPKSPFASDLYPMDRTTYLDISEWSAVGPFPKALDLFKDGSLYLIDAPGHLPGHVNLLARTSPDGAWIYLAGDSAHHWRLVTGESEIAVWKHGDGKVVGCAHIDKEVASQTIARMREVMKLPRVRILLAHDHPWYKENSKDGRAFWPGKIPSL